jgi:2-polyprenyl-3-methyl-5-hydroxy-6-metoxy-1,4-benzoquinol methylase
VCCALCGTDQTRVRFRIDLRAVKYSSVWIEDTEYQVGGSETLVQCRRCGLVYVNPRVVVSPGLAAYSTEQELRYFELSRAIRRHAYAPLLGQLPAWLGRAPASLLDIGCGDGLLVELSRQAGIASAGSEISEPLAGRVRARLGDDAIVAGDLSQLPAAQYDAVTLINVLEHVTDPAEMLANISRLLRPGGVALIHTLNIAGIPARLSGARWHQIEPLGHFYYFSSHTLGGLLRNAGLEPFDRFNLVVASGLRAVAQRLLERMGLYLDSGLGVVARRPTTDSGGDRRQETGDRR